ncbi:YlbF family regulator [Pseudogracilibacillus sp. SE30717A]|uniref:YlbF family regulator n=1 Tax=Pseudogracilibacillus sp. SE30717A TaxID=3098293 RepID=UPI00300DC679
MIATLEYVNILDKADRLKNMILQSEVMTQYEHAYNTLQKDQEAQRLINAFNHIKEHYEDVQRFGRYHPDYNEIMKNVRSTKRRMDMNSSVAEFKVAERELQRFLDEISEHIAKSVSEHIIVPKDGLALTDGGCSTGGCGSGGSCGCQAS